MFRQLKSQVSLEELQKRQDLITALRTVLNDVDVDVGLDVLVGIVVLEWKKLNKGRSEFLDIMGQAWDIYSGPKRTS